MKYLIISIFIVIILLILQGCTQNDPDNPRIYFKDYAADICYSWNGVASYSITYVPCTEKVLKLIRN